MRFLPNLDKDTSSPLTHRSAATGNPGKAYYRLKNVTLENFEAGHPAKSLNYRPKKRPFQNRTFMRNFFKCVIYSPRHMTAVYKNYPIPKRTRHIPNGHACFSNDDPARFATFYSAHPLRVLSKC